MLGLENPIHIAFVLLIVLLVFGAKRLPEMGRSLGTGLRGFKETLSGDESPALSAAHVAPGTMAHVSAPEAVAAPVGAPTSVPLAS